MLDRVDNDFSWEPRDEAPELTPEDWAAIWPERYTVSGATNNNVFVVIGENPKDINNYYEKGKMLLKKPLPPRIFMKKKKG